MELSVRLHLKSKSQPLARLASLESFTRESALAEIQGILAFGPTLRSSTRFVDTFYDTTATLGDLLLILTTLPDDSVTEIMCHPGYADAALISGYTTMRETELEILTHPSVREVIKSEGIALITFGDLQ